MSVSHSVRASWSRLNDRWWPWQSAALAVARKRPKKCQSSKFRAAVVLIAVFGFWRLLQIIGKNWLSVLGLRTLGNKFQNIYLKQVAAKLLRAVANRPAIRDPMYGFVYDSSNASDMWESLLDGLRFPKDSAMREHIRQLFSRPQLHDEMLTLFDELGHCGRIRHEEAQQFSDGIRGHIHVFTQSKKRVSLAPASSEDRQWLAERFDETFPKERPLGRASFPGFAKLVLLRRVVRTLVDIMGLEKLKCGVARPLVVDVVVELGGGRTPFRLHTIAPVSQPALPTGERLFHIIE